MKKKKYKKIDRRTYNAVLKIIKENRLIDDRLKKLKKLKSGKVKWCCAPTGNIGYWRYYPRLKEFRIQISASLGCSKYGRSANFFVIKEKIFKERCRHCVALIINNKKWWCDTANIPCEYVKSCKEWTSGGKL